MNLTEEDLRRGGKNAQNCTKKILMTQIIHDAMFAHLEPDIMESEVKWAVGIITSNKGSGCDGIHLSYFKS